MNEQNARKLANFTGGDAMHVVGSEWCVVTWHAADTVMVIDGNGAAIYEDFESWNSGGDAIQEIDFQIQF